MTVRGTIPAAAAERAHAAFMLARKAWTPSVARTLARPLAHNELYRGAVVVNAGGAR